MRIYWTLGGIPELATLSRVARGAIWRRAYTRAFRHWQTWSGLVACGVLAGIGSIVGGFFNHSFVGAALGGGLGGFVFSQVAIHVVRTHYKHLLTGGASSA